MENPKTIKATGGVCNTCQLAKASNNRETKQTYLCFVDTFRPKVVTKPRTPCVNYQLKSRSKINAAVAKIRVQFPKTQEGRFLFAIIDSAINDLAVEAHKGSAQAFLRREIVQAEICSVDSTWILETVRKCGLEV